MIRLVLETSGWFSVYLRDSSSSSRFSWAIRTSVSGTLSGTPDVSTFSGMNAGCSPASSLLYESRACSAALSSRRAAAIWLWTPAIREK